MNQTHQFSEEEQKIRSQWRISFFIITIFTILSFTYQYLSGMIPLPVSMIIFQIAFLFLMLGVQYFFIYRKHGTRWLTFILITTPITNALSIYAYTTPFAKSNSMLPLPIFLLSTILALLYLIPCYRLRKVNQRVQQEKKTLNLIS